MSNIVAWQKELNKINEYVSLTRAATVGMRSHISSPSLPATDLFQPRIKLCLEKAKPQFGQAYQQIITDINDENRVSFVGTIHELRELIASLLRYLAPDEEVEKNDWYKLEQNAKRPTQRQRVRYIMEQKQQRDRKSAEKHFSELDSFVTELVRDTYEDASKGAHNHDRNHRTEVVRLLRYFHAFIPDLLDC